MEYYVEHESGMLLARNEWHGGIRPTPKEVKQRRREIKLGAAKIVDSEVFEISRTAGSRKIQRKQ